MNIGRSSNPALSTKAFSPQTYSASYSEVMTLNGTINKSVAMLLLVVVGAMYTWKMFFGAATIEAGTALVSKWIFIGGIGGFIFSLVTIFKKNLAYITAPVYAILEGLFLGAISAFFEARFPGLVLQAVTLTFATLFLMLIGYRTGIIKVTKKLRAGIIAATGAVVMVYLISFIFSMFGAGSLIIHSNGILGIGISLIIVIIAALNLVLDFEFIAKGSQAGLPKYMEWYAAFGLMLTLVWLYIEILRLLSKLASRD
ncbi:MAG: Bax inhibitor-1/YccA family protein [Bacteroidales bacterium]|nr:Bax inhibitor-1/YccA family protein [Bacteroidales bacterium]